jgi:hypothetical protein
MEIDIRGSNEKIDRIRVYDKIDDGASHVECIHKYSSDDSVKLLDTESCEALRIFDRAHALCIIKGINKAIELGWLK